MSAVCVFHALPRGTTGAGSQSQGQAGGAAAARLPSWRLRQSTCSCDRHAHRQRQAGQGFRTAASSSPAPTVTEPISSSNDNLVEDMIEFLKEDLQHLFDDQGIDASKYDSAVVFEDPITRYDNIQGYLFNIAALKKVFAPTFTLHEVRRTGELEVTTRWTMSMCLSFAKASPLRRLFDPQLMFTGTSIMGINPETGKFNRHIDTWDAIQQQGYFSTEAFLHMLSQVFDLRQGPHTPDQASQLYQVLLKRSQYEVRQYLSSPAVAAQQQQQQPASSAAADDGAAAAAEGGSGGGVYAVASFGGEAGQQQAQQAEQALRKALAADGLQAAQGGGWLLAAGDAAASPLLRRNEVLIPLQNFKLW